MKKLRIVLLGTGAVFLLSILVFFGWFFAVTGNVKLEKNKLFTATDNIRIFDKNGDEISTFSLGNENRAFSLDELPEKVKYCFIDTEDKRFYSHHGFDGRRIVKATLNNLRAGAFKEGASTISQQLIKNTHLSQEKTLKRKAQEFRLTRRLEKNYSKDEILEAYLNTIYFGHNCFGLSSAAKFYFGKEVSSLTLSDGAILAGLVCSPNRYSPFKNPERCISRKRTVLALMEKQKHITNDERKEAENEPLPQKRETAVSSDRSYFYRVFDELEKLAESAHFRPTGKMKIYTYFDPEIENKLREIAGASGVGETYSVISSGGEVNAYLSTAHDFSRLPGSLIKPLLVYAPAFENGTLSPATAILDEKTKFGDYAPKNYGDQYFGYVSARDALSKSLNVPAVKVLSSLGVKEGVKTLEKLGLTVDEDDETLALALGGMKRGFTLTELTNAYNALSSGGEFIPYGFIDKITIGRRVLYTRSKAKTRVFSEDTAYLTTDILRDAVDTGTAKKLRSLPIDVASKTGTVGSANGNTDAYNVSYTTDYTVGVWMGNASNALHQITGGGLPTLRAYEIHEFLAKRKEPKPFLCPKSVQSVKLDKAEYESSRNLLLCDDDCPENCVLEELFSVRFLPKQKSANFTSPHVACPTLTAENGKVVMRFSLSGASKYYSLKIERKEKGKTLVVYDGKMPETFCDETAKTGKEYTYSIVPSYKNHQGKRLILPQVLLNGGQKITEPPPEIVGKEWWEK